VALSLMLFGLSSCFQNLKTEEEMKTYDGPMMETKNGITVYSDSAIRRMQVTSPRQQVLVNGDRNFPEGVLVEFYNEIGVKSAELTAEKGYFTKHNAQYKAEGNVKVRNIQKGETLTTEELFWDSRKEKIYTEKHVLIETPKERITAEGMEAKQDFSSYKLKKLIGQVSLE
jgi:LPS export ABC transporter protein LptC